MKLIDREQQAGTKPYVYDLSLEEWQEWIKLNGEPGFRAGQIFDWLYVKRISSFDEMSNLPKTLRDKLSQHFDFVTMTEVAKYASKDGTVKFLFELSDKNAIETVIMKHSYGNSVCDNPSGLSHRLYLLCINTDRTKAEFDTG